MAIEKERRDKKEEVWRICKCPICEFKIGTHFGSGKNRGELAPFNLSEAENKCRIGWRRNQGILPFHPLLPMKVGERMAEKCGEILRSDGLDPRFEIVDDDTAPQKGTALFIAALSDRGCVIGADQAGAVGRLSESIGEFVARSLLEDLRTGATVDRHLADQLILFSGLAAGTTAYIIPRMTEHIETNIWLIETILGATVDLNGNRLTIRGTGFTRKGTSAGR